MGSPIDGLAAGGLERSCAQPCGDTVRIAPASGGLERVEARFSGHAFDPHRHDTYAIGHTLSGVQSFRYRGAEEHSLPGHVFVLHPDEMHDGHAGTEAGFRYRILYIAPELIRAALGDARPLPFVRDAVGIDRRLIAAIRPALADFGRPLEPLERDAVIADVADTLAARDPATRNGRISPRHRAGVLRARDALAEDIGGGLSSSELEAISGLDRYELARQFRALIGTSPHRYLVMRRLDRVRAMIAAGTPLAEAAAACGFADQSHMTRHFRSTYGMTPGRWAALAAPAAA